MALSREEAKKIARENLEKRFNDRNVGGGFSGARAIDLSKIGGFRKNLFYRPRDGQNHIDILPYIIKTDNHPQKMKKGEPDYVLDIWVHRRVGSSEGTYLCLQKMYGKPCPICEERVELKKDPTADEVYLKSLMPKRRCWYNVVNLDLPEREQEIQIFEESHFLFEKELLEESGSGGELLIFWDLEEGRTVSFRATEEKSPAGKFFRYKRIDFEKREPYKDNVYSNTFALDDLLIIPTYEEVRNAHMSIDAPDEEEKQDAKEEPRREESRGMGGLRDSKKEDDSPRRSSLRGDDSPRREEKAEEPSRREEPKSSDKCDHGHKYGGDHDEYKECSKCNEEIWTACGQEKKRSNRRG
jgi:hypothetical protein